MCCAIAALLLALFPAWPGALDAVRGWMERARWMAIGLIAAVTLAAGTALAADHALRGEASWLQKICVFVV